MEANIVDTAKKTLLTDARLHRWKMHLFTDERMHLFIDQGMLGKFIFLQMGKMLEENTLIYRLENDGGNCILL
jgi:hypothetical protein